MQLYTPAYVLSPKADFRFKSVTDQAEQSNINGSILFCSYCLSDDQRYLLVSCSDERGEFFETSSINIEVPERSGRMRSTSSVQFTLYLIDIRGKCRMRFALV